MFDRDIWKTSVENKRVYPNHSGFVGFTKYWKNSLTLEMKDSWHLNQRE